MSNASAITEADILEQVVTPDQPGFSQEAAKSILALRFSEAAHERIRGLLDANNRGTLSPADQAELDKYLRVGQFLDLLQAKARLSLADPNAA